MPAGPEGLARCAILAVAVAALVSCSNQPVTPPAAGAPPGAPPVAEGSPPASGPSAPGSGPVITAFHVIGEITCSGSSAPAPASWSTRGAQTVSFEVDGQAPGAGAGYPVSGTGDIPVPCDGREHEVEIVAAAGGTQVTRSAHVNTSGGPPPAGSPAISNFQILGDVSCPSGPSVDVAASWTTTDADAISFSVDGQPLPAAAGFAPSGSGEVPVPCDGRAHKVTLTASGQGGAQAALSRSVNTTTDAASGGTPAPPTTG